MNKQQIGVIGLAVMGKNLALNLERLERLLMIPSHNLYPYLKKEMF
ncbi:6-phosphogluconate dehydrogenase [Paenibacillus macquariensis]|uniref:6-phosphogluconate dehydrogenase n=1 Tax=Paenibacillus macquariensis TaxID=948756 RepID=A0ABY1JN26_9BACL|nr:6-phosphogluconate dehydrogenase [Paenibacillus macquariensis]